MLRVIAVLLCLMAVLFCSACGGGHNSTIAVIPRDTAEEVWVSEHGGAADEAYRQNLEIDWNGPTRDDDVEQQIRLAEAAIQAGAYGLILSPNNSFALGTVIHRALTNGIPVVIVGSPIPIAPQMGLSFVLNDSDKMGELAAKRAAEEMHGEGQILVLGADSLSPGSVERADAFEQALRRNAPEINVVEDVAGTMSFGQAELATEQAIAAHPGLSAIFAVGINETRGAVAAVRSTNSLGRIHIIGCDQTLELLLMLRQGYIDSLVIENTRAMGRLAVTQIAAERKGRAGPRRQLVDPVLVTRANVDEDRIQQILSLRWRPTQ